MTNEEFLQEALASDKCPKDFEQDYAYFCKYQQMTIDTLRAFADACRKRGVHFQLAFGSLLGAVRDGGQIPWDYDVDVIVPYAEREQLFAALNEELDPKFCYYAPEKDREYRTSFPRIVPRGIPNQMIHVDVFYVTGLPEDDAECARYCKEIRDRFDARMYTTENLADYPYNLKFKLMRKLMKCRYLLRYGPKKARGDCSEVFSRYDLKTSTRATVISGRAGKKLDPAKWYLESTEYETREGTFPVTAYYEDFLKNRFGDWQKYFPIENRIAEVRKHCRKFRWYEPMLNDTANPRIIR